MLDQFEEDSGFRLPLSYRAFAKVFGPGELAWEYSIMAPGYPEQGDFVDLARFNQCIRRPITKAALRRLKVPDQVLRTVYFARTGTGDLIGWDPADVRDARRREYGIYVLGRGDAMPKLADAFPSFIADVCLGAKNLNPPGWDFKEFGSRRTFFPRYDVADT